MNPSSPLRRARSHVTRFRVFIFLVLLGATVFVAPGCNHRAFRNAPGVVADTPAAYRFRAVDALPGTDDETFVILAFSGGGTRAAALSFGVMEGLSHVTYTRRGQTRSLLDDVHIISSVSGGSFTAAYYGLHPRDEFFNTFPDRFLYQKVQTGLVLGLFNPLNWPKLASPYYSRIDMAAEYYDRLVFDNKTFADIARGPGHPFIILNSTDMACTGHFEFTQDQFDVLGSDLSSYPISRGVAASSAFPILLAPMTVTTYPKPDGTRPGWITAGLKARTLNARSYATAVQNDGYYTVPRDQYIHLLDGGLADNIGLRGPAGALMGDAMPWTLQPQLNGGTKHLVVIMVDAHTEGASPLSTQESTPGVIPVLGTVTGGPMNNYSADTIQQVGDLFTQLRQNYDVAKKLYPNGPALASPPNLYMIKLSFAEVSDPTARAKLNLIPTTFQLSRAEVDDLRAAGKNLIEASTVKNQLIQDLQKSP